jgi:hypothetical protein
MKEPVFRRSANEAHRARSKGIEPYLLGFKSQEHRANLTIRLTGEPPQLDPGIVVEGDEWMSKTTAWHSRLGGPYHNDTRYNTGNNIEKGNRVPGTGGRPHCEECADWQAGRKGSETAGRTFCSKSRGSIAATRWSYSFLTRTPRGTSGLGWWDLAFQAPRIQDLHVEATTLNPSNKLG